MRLYEYQAYSLLHRFGVPTLPYHLVRKGVESSFFSQPGFEKAFLKVQRCESEKKGENTLVEAFEEANAVVDQLFSTDVAKIMAVPYVAIESRYYLAISIDRKKGVSFIASIDDELSLEERVKERRLFREIVPEKRRLHQFQIRRLLSHLGIKKNSKGMSRVIEGMVKAFFYFDAVRIEISPLGCTEDGNFLALDIQMQIDDNALFRQPEVRHLIETAQAGTAQAGTAQAGAAQGRICQPLEGNIGCMANGRGLAMATCDLVRVVGGLPAEVLDIGRSVTKEKIIQGLQSLYEEERVERVFVNIFTGLVDCEKIARAVREYIKKNGPIKPTIFRLEGTNAAKGYELLKKLDPELAVTMSLKEAAKMVME